MFGPVEHAENRALIDLGLREKAILVAVLVPIVWIGVHPKPFLGPLQASVIELVERVERGSAPRTAAAPAPAGAPAPAPEDRS
jgi:NADH-quinone oxidoreductase subunit M